MPWAWMPWTWMESMEWNYTTIFSFPDQLYAVSGQVHDFLYPWFFFRGSDYYEQHFIVSTGIDCRLPATIYVRVTDRQILTWIQKVTGNYPRPLEPLGRSREIKKQKAKKDPSQDSSVVSISACYRESPRFKSWQELKKIINIITLTAIFQSYSPVNVCRCEDLVKF